MVSFWLHYALKSITNSPKKNAVTFFKHRKTEELKNPKIEGQYIYNIYTISHNVFAYPFWL